MKRFLLSSLLLLPLSVFAEGGLPNQPYIYVAGKAEIETPADMAKIFFDVVARNADQVKANQEVQAKAAKILALLNQRGVAENDVTAQDLRSEPIFEQEETYSRKGNKIVGYSITRSFMIKLRKLGAFAKLVDELIAFGGLEFSQIEAGLSNKKELEDQVWDNALIDARERAEKTLKKMGMKIDSIFALSPSAFPEIPTKIFGGERVVVTGSNIPTAKEHVDPSQYRFEPIVVNESVHVIYLISPVK